MKLISEAQPDEVAKLESRLVEFYNTCTTYPAFSRPSDYPALWTQVANLARQLSAGGARCRILEIGAGRSGFGPFLESLGVRRDIHLTSQDITSTNIGYLRETSDEVINGNIDGLRGTWDIIFHSYVYEHLCRPRQFNEMLWDCLAPGGYLAIQSPRYDFPLYPPPCFDHLTAPRKLGLMLRLAGRDVLWALRGEPQFTVFSDPAVFYLPFERDRDAVHRVRRADLRRLFGGRAEIRDFPLASGSVKDWLVKRFLTLRLVLRKKE